MIIRNIAVEQRMSKRSSSGGKTKYCNVFLSILERARNYVCFAFYPKENKKGIEYDYHQGVLRN